MSRKWEGPRGADRGGLGTAASSSECNPGSTGNLASFAEYSRRALERRRAIEHRSPSVSPREGTIARPLADGALSEASRAVLERTFAPRELRQRVGQAGVFILASLELWESNNDDAPELAAIARFGRANGYALADDALLRLTYGRAFEITWAGSRGWVRLRSGAYGSHAAAGRLA